MFSFFFRYLSKNIFRSIALIMSVFIIFIVIFGSVYLYKNTASAIEYYSYQGNNENQVTFQASSTILNIFSTEKSFSDEEIEKIMNDNRFEKQQVYRLVSIPVSAKFGLFSFDFETDIPVFSVTDGVLSGAKIPAGFSQTMLDIYNTQFAGSAKVFPQFGKNFILGQKIDFTFGKSKIFQPIQKIADSFTATITEINNNFPAFGLVLPESIVREKMQEVGYSLGDPYKIIVYMKNIDDKKIISEEYKSLNPQFEIDKILKIKNKISFIGKIIAITSGGIIFLLTTFFLFLLSGFFRERKNIFKIVSLFGLKSYKSYFITMGEPLFLGGLGIIFGILLGVYFINITHQNIANILQTHGILFPVQTLTIFEILYFGIILFIALFLFISFFEYKERRTYVFQ